MADETLQIIGLCRFSVPGLGGFQTEHDSFEARRAHLYAPQRLNLRIAWFRHVCLPCIRAQTDPGFTFVVLLGEDLPDPWRAEVLALVSDIPQAVVEYAPPVHHRDACADAMRRHVDPAATLLAQFRLDDDDAVSVNFVERLRRDLHPMMLLMAVRQNLAIDYARGLVLTWQNRLLSVEPRLARQWTPALAYVNRPAADRFVMDAQHHRMWYHMPVLSLPDGIMWVRGAHGLNDSRIDGARDRYDLAEGEADRLVRNRFRIDTAALARALLDIGEAGT